MIHRVRGFALVAIAAAALVLALPQAANGQEKTDLAVWTKIRLLDGEEALDQFEGKKFKNDAQRVEAAQRLERALREARVMTESLPRGEKRNKLTEARNLLAMRASFTTTTWRFYDEAVFCLTVDGAREHMDLGYLSAAERKKVDDAFAQVNTVWTWRYDPHPRLEFPAKIFDKPAGEVAEKIAAGFRESQRRLRALAQDARLRPYFLFLQTYHNRLVEDYRGKTVLGVGSAFTASRFSLGFVGAYAVKDDETAKASRQSASTTGLAPALGGAGERPR